MPLAGLLIKSRHVVQRHHHIKQEVLGASPKWLIFVVTYLLLDIAKGRGAATLGYKRAPGPRDVMVAKRREGAMQGMLHVKIVGGVYQGAWKNALTLRAGLLVCT